MRGQKRCGDKRKCFMMCQAESSSDYWEEDEELEDVRQFADIVEAALALHVATTMGYNFSNLEDTAACANWLVHSLLGH